MQKIIGFIGYVNKSEFIINLSKILKIMNKKVLVVDGTLNKSIKYTIPTFDVAQDESITNFDGTDYAVGFKSIESIKEYICNKTSIADDYDYILLDIDNKENYEYFKDENIMFVGDFVFYGTVGRCDLEGGNFQEMLDSIQKLKNYPDSTILYPGHGKDTILGQEKQNNPYFRN